MTTIKEFAQQCAELIREKKTFLAYWYPDGTGVGYLRHMNMKQVRQFQRAVDKLWKNPDVHPMYIVDCVDGNHALIEKSAVSELLRDILAGEGGAA